MRVTDLPTAIDPYPHYAAWRAKGGLVPDPETGLTLATDAATVRAVLSDSQYVVRPEDAPVPPALTGTTAGDVFGRLIRMTEGPARTTTKQAMMTSLSRLQPETLQAKAFVQTQLALEQAAFPIAPMNLAFSIPVEVMAAEIGFDAADVARIRALISHFVHCISPLSDDAQITQAQTATGKLLDAARRLISENTDGVAAQFCDAVADNPDMGDLLGLANIIGVMSQTFDATAALIGQSLVAMARHDGPWDIHQQVTPDLLNAVVRETARLDAPIQNTRRFHRDGTALLLLLASANRDGNAIAAPDDFDITRKSFDNYTFSFARHRCPGDTFGIAITSGVLGALLQAGYVPKSHVPTDLRYLPSANARIPDLPSVSP